MALHPLPGGPGVVHGLLRAAGDPPVAKPGLRVLAVELQVEGIAGIALVRRPHLLAGCPVPAEGRHPGREQIAPARGGRVLAEAVLDKRRAGDARVLHEEVLDALGREPLVEPGAHAPLAVRPLRSPVGALGQPEAARPAAEEAPVGLHAGAHLREHRAVALQQRQERVGRGRGQHLDRLLLLKPPQGARDIAVELGEPEPVALIKGVPPVLGHGPPGRVGAKALDVVVRPADPVFHVLAEAVLHVAVRELL